MKLMCLILLCPLHVQGTRLSFAQFIEFFSMTLYQSFFCSLEFSEVRPNFFLLVSLFLSSFFKRVNTREGVDKNVLLCCRLRKTPTSLKGIFVFITWKILKQASFVNLEISLLLPFVNSTR